MAKSTAYKNDLLKLIFNADDFANIADDTLTTPATTLTVALHTTDPSLGDNDQSEGEIGYTGYGRVAVARTDSGWAVVLNSVSPVANIVFGEMMAGVGGSAGFFSVGTGFSDYMLYSGAIDTPINVVNGIIPTLTTDTAITED